MDLNQQEKPWEKEKSFHDMPKKAGGEIFQHLITQQIGPLASLQWGCNHT